MLKSILSRCFTAANPHIGICAVYELKLKMNVDLRKIMFLMSEQLHDLKVRSESDLSVNLRWMSA